MKLVWCLALAVGMIAGALGFVQTGSSRLEARLTGGGNDKGKAKWVVRDANGEMQAQLEVEGENLVPNQLYIIHINGNLPWSVESDAFGAFDFEQLYRGPARPTIPSGSSVVVTDAAGNTILLGTLLPR